MFDLSQSDRRKPWQMSLLLLHKEHSWTFDTGTNILSTSKVRHKISLQKCPFIEANKSHENFSIDTKTYILPINIIIINIL